MDALNKNLRGQLDDARAETVQLKNYYTGEMQDLTEEVEKLKAQVNLEKSKRKELAKERLQKNDKMYQNFERKMLEQEKQIMKLQD